MPTAVKPGRVAGPPWRVPRRVVPNPHKYRESSIQTPYPCEQAGTLLAKLADDESARSQLLADPQATLREYGFEIDIGALSARVELAERDECERALAKLDHEQSREKEAKQKMIIFVYC